MKKERLFNLKKKSVQVSCLVTLLLAATVTLSFASIYSQSAKITLNEKDVSIGELFAKIENQTEFDIFYNNDDIDVNETVSIDVENSRIEYILDEILESKDIDYQVVDKHIVLSSKNSEAISAQPSSREFNLNSIENRSNKTQVQQQEITVSGTITSKENGEPLPGVNIIVEGTTVGTISDLDGKYTINVPDANASLSFSFIGYMQQVIPINGQSTIDVVLEEETRELDEVVVIGYGAVKKSDLTGSIASVKTEEINKISTTNVNQAIQGRVAGVMITSASGAPGSQSTVRIRGVSTVNNSDPLYVVDGFPTDNISFLNPSSIESMEVLKDASATAIYGNRGAAGVILITTKKGGEKESSINFNSYFGIQEINKKMPMLDAQGWAEAKYTAYDNNAEIRDRDPLTGSGEELDLALQEILATGDKGTDWQDEVLQQGKIQKYELEIIGGKDKYSYSLSGSYDREEGIIIETWQNRYNFRYAGQSQLKDFLKTNFSVAYQNVERANYDFELYWQGVLPNALVGDPGSPVYRTDTNYYSGVLYSQTPNPVAAAHRGKGNKTYIDQFVGNFGIDLNITKDLIFTSNFGGDINWQHDKRYIPDYYIASKDYGVSSLDETHRRDFAWNNSNFLNFTKTKGNHDINLMLGQEWSSFNRVKMRYIVYDIPENESLQYPHFSPLTTPPAFNPSMTAVNRPAYSTTLFSYFGRAFYNYNNLVLLTGTIRRDAASQVAADYRWGTFPSFSTGINLKNIGPMADVGLLSSLKVRYGWGKTGNIKSLANVYTTFGTVAGGWDYVGENDAVLPGYIQTSGTNEKLQWEEVVQSNIALDFGFLENKLTGTIDLFKKITTGMIAEIPPPFFTGMTASEGNFGEMENKGIEFQLNYRNYDNEFKYDIGANVTFLNKPWVTKWSEPTTVGSATKIFNVIRVAEDEEFAHFYGYETDGVLTQDDIDNTFVIDTENGDTTFTYNPEEDWFWFPGQLKLVDINGDGEISEEDKTNIGSANPDLFYGFNINLMYKGIDLTMFFQGVYGNQLINGICAWLKFPDEGNLNLHEEVLEGWSPENPNTDVPRLVQGNPIMQNYFNDYIVEDASYLRLKNIQLGYTIPEKLLTFAGVKKFRIYVSAENILTFTKYGGYDPEVGRTQFDESMQKDNPLIVGIDQATYPVPKKIIFGLNLSF
ncbi:TonB-dependent receptor [Bacteroidota bacterium]